MTKQTVLIIKTVPKSSFAYGESDVVFAYRTSIRSNNVSVGKGGAAGS